MSGFSVNGNIRMMRSRESGRAVELEEQNMKCSNKLEQLLKEEK
jgi:hypothetical protein